MALTKIPGSFLDTTSGINGLIYPTSDGTAGQFLKTDGSGNLTFATVTTYTDSDVETYLDGGTSTPTFASATVSGALTVTGDLNITGDINSYNVTDLDVTDQTITLGAGQIEANSGGSGIIVDGSGASILWDETNDVFDINKGLTTLGNVGIGTSSPDANLDIESNLPTIRLTETDDSTYSEISQSFGYLTINNDAGNSGTGDAIIFKIDNSEKVRFTSGGNVGIGTSNPQMGLHVGSGTQSTAALAGIGIANGGSDYSFYSASDGTKQYIAGIDHNITYTKAGSLSNHSHAIITNNTNAIFIDTSQNVGIGTDSPTGAKLHVTGGVKATDLIAHDSTGINLQTDEGTKRLVVTDAGNITFPGQTTTFNNPGFTHHTNNYLYLRGGSSGLILADDQNHNVIQIVDGASGYINFETSNGTSRMRLDSSGNLGVGITTVQQLQSDSVYPRIQSYSSATTGHFCGLMIGRPNSPGLESSLAFTVGGIMVGKIQHDYVASNHNDMSFHLRGATPGTDIEVMRLWAGSGTDTALLVGRTTRSWTSAKLEVESNARIGNLYFTGSGSDSTISAGNGNYKFSTATVTCGSTGLDFDVNVVVTGVGIANRFKVDSPTGDTYTNDGTISSLSDIRVKTDINNLTDGLEIVKQLRPVTFKYNDDSTDDDGNGMLAAADDKIRYGFIAQEVEEVAPHYVETSTRKINNEEVDDFKSLSTTRMIPMLFKAIQELSTELDAAKARITELENA